MLREVGKAEMPGGGRVEQFFFFFLMRHLEYSVGFHLLAVPSPYTRDKGRCLKVIKFLLHLYWELGAGGGDYNIRRKPYFCCFLMDLTKTCGGCESLQSAVQDVLF